jgi:hypothetical protein
MIQMHTDWDRRERYIDAAVRVEDAVDSAMAGEASA